MSRTKTSQQLIDEANLVPYEVEIARHFLAGHSIRELNNGYHRDDVEAILRRMLCIRRGQRGARKELPK